MDNQNIQISPVIREASREDASLLAELIRRSFRDVADRFGLTVENAPKHPSNCTDQWVISAIEKGVVYYILESEGLPGACGALERARPGVGYLERLAVLPGFRGRGLGEALMGHILERSRSLGIHRIEIGIIAEQTDLAAWYEKRGFQWNGTKRFPHLPFTVAFMSIDL